MSRAFVKEDLEVPERSIRRRSASGLPPGALNYLTSAGAAALRARMEALQRAPGKDEAERERLHNALATATIVEPRTPGEMVTFGAAVTVQLGDGGLETYWIVGVDEVDLAPGNVSWVSPIGKALLGAEIGQRVAFAGAEHVLRTVRKIE